MQMKKKPLLPIELVEDIFSRLPVKLLLQLRCMCKFAKTHLSMTKAYKHHHHLMLTTDTVENRILLWDSHITTSIFTILLWVSGGIVSLDLATESYHQLLLPPPTTAEGLVLTLGVLRDCLCLCASNKDML